MFAKFGIASPDPKPVGHHHLRFSRPDGWATRRRGLVDQTGVPGPREVGEGRATAAVGVRPGHVHAVDELVQIAGIPDQGEVNEGGPSVGEVGVVTDDDPHAQRRVGRRGGSIADDIDHAGKCEVHLCIKR